MFASMLEELIITNIFIIHFQLLQILFFCKKFISCFHYGTLLFDVNG